MFEPNILNVAGYGCFGTMCGQFSKFVRFFANVAVHLSVKKQKSYLAFIQLGKKYEAF